MSTTRAVLRRLFLENLGGADKVSLTPSASGAAGGGTLVDTRWSGESNDVFNNQWITLPLGPAGVTTYEARQISDFVGSSGTFTLLVTASATITTAASYEIMPHNPAVYHVCLNRAADLVFPDLYIPRRDETLMVDQLLSNGHFDTYAASAFTGWSNVATPTLAQETTRVWHGSSSASIGASAGAEEGLSQNLFTSVNVHDVAGKTLHVKGHVWASAASTARLRVTFDGSTYTNGPWHGGSSEWEGYDTMYIDVVVPTTATQMTVICSVASGGTAYFDDVVAYIDTLTRYTVPSGFARRPNAVYVQMYADKPLGAYRPVRWHPEEVGETHYIILDELLAAGMVLRVEGEGALSTMSADTDTVEISAPQRELLIAHAALYFYTSTVEAAASMDAQKMGEFIDLWSKRIAWLEPRVKMPPKPVHISRPWYYV